MSLFTTCLVVAAVALLAAWPVALWREKRTFSRPAAAFLRLRPAGKVTVAILVALALRAGGSKRASPDGDSCQDASALRESVGVPRQVLPTDGNTNAFAITFFDLDSASSNLTFAVSWDANAFENAASRNVAMFSSSNLLARTWTFAGEYPMPTNATSHTFTVSATNVFPSAHSAFLDSFAGRGFYRFGLDVDTDGDGLSDIFERIVSLSNPFEPDSDLDGLPDGVEWSLGTDPTERDTDGDELSDIDEIGYVRSSSDDCYIIPIIANLTEALLADVSMCADFDLPISVPVLGDAFDKISVDVNGVVYLRKADDTDPMLSRCDFTDVSLASCPSDAFMVAAYWTRLGLSTNSPASSVLVRRIDETILVEYANMRILDATYPEESLISLQVLFPDVNYPYFTINYCLVGSEPTSGLDAHIGICGKDGASRRSISLASVCLSDIWSGIDIFPSYMTNPAMTDTDSDGLSDSAEILMYHTNPCMFDTDADGLSDSQELSLGTNARCPDTDGDGMLDGWESLYLGVGFDPNVDSAIDTNPYNDAAADPDGDGLNNYEESYHGTNPNKLDSDDDGVSDGQEAQQGSNPNDMYDNAAVRWIVLIGDGDENQNIATNVTLKVIAGKSALFAVFAHSDEFPNYTGIGSEYNDRLVYEIRCTSAPGHPAISDFISVNEENIEWTIAQVEGQTVVGFTPVVLINSVIYSAPKGMDLTINVRLNSMNIGDRFRPSSLIVGVFPLMVEQANMPVGCGVAGSTDAETAYSHVIIPTNDVAYITGQPLAPEIECRISGLPGWIGVDWSGVLTTERWERFTYDDRILTSNTTYGVESYDVTAALDHEIIGGRCELRLAVEGAPCAKYPFFIRGKNPKDAIAKAYITANVPTNSATYAWKISKHECKAGRGTRFYNQFNAVEDSFKGLPFKGVGGGNWGWGLAQIDRGSNNTHTAEIYNWRTNVAAMSTKLLEAKRLTDAFVLAYSGAYSSLPTWTDPPSTNVNGSVVSAEMWSVLTLYNGAEGIPWQTTPTHPAQFRSPLQFVPSTGEWRFLHNTRNPDYVADVILDGNKQEVE